MVCGVINRTNSSFIVFHHQISKSQWKEDCCLYEYVNLFYIADVVYVCWANRIDASTNLGPIMIYLGTFNWSTLLILGFWCIFVFFLSCWQTRRFKMGMSHQKLVNNNNNDIFVIYGRTMQSIRQTKTHIGLKSKT